MFIPSLKQIHLAYEDGWNSFNEGVDYFHNPFSVKHKELHNFRNLIYLCIKCHNNLHKHKYHTPPWANF
jgi:hypothetical protein